MLGKRVAPLAQSLGSSLVIPCDVEDIASVDAVFDTLDRQWENLDFVVHAIGFSDKSQLKGSYVDVTTRENFSRTMVISCFSFTEIAQRAAKRMKNGTLVFGRRRRTSSSPPMLAVSSRVSSSEFGARKNEARRTRP